MRRVYERNVTYNPDPDFNDTPTWHYLYKIGHPPIVHDGKYVPCPKSTLRAGYAGHLVHHSPYPGAVEGFKSAYGWISRRREEKGEPWQLELRSPSQCMLVLGWQSPAEGRVRIDAKVAPMVGTGATLTIEHSRPFRQLLLRNFKVGEGGPIALGPIAVRKGDQVYFAAETPSLGGCTSLVFESLRIALVE